MVSEWMDHGDINKFVKNFKGVNRVQLVSNYAISYGDRRDRAIQLVDAANGLEYMHSIHMVHGDLKGVLLYQLLDARALNDVQANILINHNFRACLADFGLSTIVGMGRCAAAGASLISVTSGASLVSFTPGGTTRWMSPELLYPEQFGITDDRPTRQSDCYALGMVVYEVRPDTTAPTFAMVRPAYRQVLYGNVPYWDITNEGGVINAIMNGQRPQKPEAAESLGFTSGVWGIVQRCWSADAGARPDVRTVLSYLNHAAWSWERRRLV